MLPRLATLCLVAVRKAVQKDSFGEQNFESATATAINFRLETNKPGTNFIFQCALKCMCIRSIYFINVHENVWSIICKATELSLSFCNIQSHKFMQVLFLNNLDCQHRGNVSSCYNYLSTITHNCLTST